MLVFRSITLSYDWYVFQLAMAYKFFDGLTNVHALATA